MFMTSENLLELATRTMYGLSVSNIWFWDIVYVQSTHSGKPNMYFSLNLNKFIYMYLTYMHHYVKTSLLWALETSIIYILITHSVLSSLTSIYLSHVSTFVIRTLYVHVCIHVSEKWQKERLWYFVATTCHFVLYRYIYIYGLL